MGQEIWKDYLNSLLMNFSILFGTTSIEFLWEPWNEIVWPGPVAVVHPTSREPRLGCGLLMKAGRLNVSATLYLFPDQDCSVSPDWLTQSNEFLLSISLTPGWRLNCKPSQLPRRFHKSSRGEAWDSNIMENAEHNIQNKSNHTTNFLVSTVRPSPVFH